MPMATESEAHAEWHRNAGVPIWEGTCPWDACGHGQAEMEAEAADAAEHEAWHREAGTPLWQGGCPWQCGPSPYDEPDNGPDPWSADSGS